MTADGLMATFADTSKNSLISIVKIDSLKPKKQTVSINDKKKLADNKIKNNKRIINPLSIMKKPAVTKPKAKIKKRGE
jgi:hypothetical protein